MHPANAGVAAWVQHVQACAAVAAEAAASAARVASALSRYPRPLRTLDDARKLLGMEQCLFALLQRDWHAVRADAVSCGGVQCCCCCSGGGGGDAAVVAGRDSAAAGSGANASVGAMDASHAMGGDGGGEGAVEDDAWLARWLASQERAGTLDAAPPPPQPVAAAQPTPALGPLVAAGDPSTAPSIPLDGRTWQLVCLVDSREVKTRTDRHHFASRLMGRGVLSEERQLPLGDFVWVVRRVPQRPHGVSSTCLPPPPPPPPPPSTAPAVGTKRKRPAHAPAQGRGGDGGGGEWVVGVIVERKSVGDLCASIMDGRYQEQKRRLMASGCRVTYMVEGPVDKAHHAGVGGYGGCGRPAITSDHLRSAMATTQVWNAFHIVTTSTLDASIQWLATMHSSIHRALFTGAASTHSSGAGGAAPLVDARRTYTAWAAAACKPRTFTTLELFGRMLRQVAGCSADKAEAVLGAHPTPTSLMDMYAQVPHLAARGPDALKDLPVPRQTRRLGPAVSAALFSSFCLRSGEGSDGVACPPLPPPPAIPADGNADGPPSAPRSTTTSTSVAGCDRHLPQHPSAGAGAGRSVPRRVHSANAVRAS